MRGIILNYAKKMTRDDLVRFVNNNGFKATDEEIDIIYEHIKKYYNVFLDDPVNYIKILKGKISDDNYYNILMLFDQYKCYLK